MKSILYLFILPLFTSCEVSKPVIKRYKPAMISIGLTYMPKPSSFDSVKIANYISVGILQGYNGANKNDENYDIMNLAQVAYNRAHCFKNVNIAYGIDAFAGTYNNNSLPSEQSGYFSRKSVHGFQLKTSINTFKTGELYNFRIIGLDLSYSKEYGDFSKFRQSIQGTENIYALPQTGLFMAGLSSEIIFRRRKSASFQYGGLLALKNRFGRRQYSGFDYSGGDAGNEKGLSASLALYFQLKRYFCILEGSEGSRVNIGYRF